MRKCKNEKEKVEKQCKIRDKYEKKSERSEKLHTSVKRSKVCLYKEK